MCAIYPVIHYVDDATALENAGMAQAAGADGVFLISHENQDVCLGPLAQRIRSLWPTARLGLNFLSSGIDAAMHAVLDHQLDMLWTDDCGVSSLGVTPRGGVLEAFAMQHPGVTVFGSVAFKYQKTEAHPELAARQALACGFLPTTSGSATGSAPALDKIQRMSQAVEGRLAVASGMTVENVSAFAPYLSAILVATGVSIDEHHFCERRLRAFVLKVKQGGAA